MATRNEQAVRLSIPTFETHVQDPSIPFVPDSLRTLPPELREKIFVLSRPSRDTLAAFRCDRVLYPEVLAVFYDTHRFFVGNDFDPAQGQLSRASIGSIRHISATFEREINHDLLTYDSRLAGGNFNICLKKQTDIPPTISNPPFHHFSKAPVKSVSIELEQYRQSYREDEEIEIADFQQYGRGAYHYGYFGEVLRAEEIEDWCDVNTRLSAHTIVCAALHCLEAFSNLKVFYYSFTFGQMTGHMGHKENGIDVLNLGLGIAGKLERVSTHYWVVFFWKAEEGRCLQWKNPSRLPGYRGIFWDYEVGRSRDDEVDEELEVDEEGEGGEEGGDAEEEEDEQTGLFWTWK